MLLRGFSLKERPLSPPPGNVTAAQSQIPNATIPMTSLPSPLGNNDSPSQTSQASGVSTGVVPAPVYRPPSVQGINQLPQQTQNMVNPNMVGIVNTRGPLMGNNPMNIPQLAAPPGYHQPNRPRWPTMMTRPYMQPNQQTQQNPAQGSALIAQLTQPPPSLPAPGINQNQFGQSTVCCKIKIFKFCLLRSYIVTILIL